MTKVWRRAWRLVLGVIISLGATHAGELHAGERVDLTKVDRAIAKEPKYQDQPRYALLVFGPKADRRAWLVMDGEDVLYIDRNGNGDLTEEGERAKWTPRRPRRSKSLRALTRA